MEHHPDLTKKLKLLYHLRVNPKISSHTKLAAEFGITKQAISRWIHGSDTRRGNHIPITQLKNLATLFQIKEHWFALPFDEFRDCIFNRLESPPAANAPRPEKISISQLPSTNAEVFGRERELEILNNAWQQAQTNVVQLVAFGGVGKSCLINYWLSTLNGQNYLGASQVYAWSFYWQGAASEMKSSGDFFIEHALAWFGDPEPARGTSWAKANRLAKLVRQSRTLLVLDGLEPLQHPPGPKFGHVENPAVAFLIKELAAENTGLCLISTRLPVSDLEPYTDKRVVTLQLQHLSTPASVALLKNLQVNGSDSEIQEAVNKYSCHPLSLTLLGGYLHTVYHGDIQQMRMLNSLFEEEGHSDHAKKIMGAYLDWFDETPEKALLFLIGLIDRTTSLSELKIIAAQENVPGLTDQLATLAHAQWSYVSKRLSDARLVNIHYLSGTQFIDCHPLVKEYAILQLKRENKSSWVKGNELLFKYYQQNVPENPENLAELDNLFRAVIHGTQAGLYRDAFRLYFFRIKNGFTMLSRGSHYSDQACLRAFFDEPWSTPVAELTEEEQIHLFSNLAANQMSLGRIQAAIGPAEKSLNWYVGKSRWLEAAAYAGPYISMLIAVGRLQDVDVVMKVLDPYVENSKNEVLMAMGSVFHAYISYLAGDNDAAAKRFEMAERFITRTEPGESVSFPTISSYYCKFLLETGNDQAALERLLKTFAWRMRKTWQVAIDTPSIHASDLLILGLTFLARGDLANAKKYLDKQVELFRSAEEWLYLPTGLHSRARYYIRVKDYQSATSDLDEALRVATGTGTIFGEWESYLNFAQLYRAQQDVAQCAASLQKARSLPNMHMYRFRDAELMELEGYIANASSSRVAAS